MPERQRLITIFTPSCADESDTNAQNLTVKELVARLPADRFHVTMSVEVAADPRISARPNTMLIPWTDKGNALRLLRHCIFSRPDIYFFPRCGPLDRAFFDFRKHLPCRTALVSYIVTTMNANTRTILMDRSVLESDMVCSNSNFIGDTVRKEFGRESIVMHDGVDSRFYFPAKSREPSGRLRVLYAGSFSPLKRPELVIEQARRWREVEFLMAGKGVTEPHCRKLRDRYGCANVHFLGHLSSQRLGYEMRRADVFLFPSLLEGHPQVLIQALACGLPVVAMDSYHPDCVVNGKTGFLATSDEELSDCLGLLLSEPELRNSMATASAAHARNFDWDRISERWADLFNRLVTARQKLSWMHSDVANTA